MPNKLSLSRRQVLWIAWFIISFLLFGYSKLEENYFPANTECSLYRRISGSLCVFAAHQNGTNHIAFFTADSQSIIYSDNKTLRIEPIGIIKSITSGYELEHPNPIFSIGISKRHDKVAVCNWDYGNRPPEIWIWNIVGRNLIKQILSSEIQDCASALWFSPDDSTVAFEGAPSKILFVNWETSEIMSIPGTNVIFSPTGDQVAVENDEKINVLTYPSLITISTFGFTGALDNYVFSPNGLMLASGYNDIYLWDTINGKVIDKFEEINSWNCNRLFLDNQIISCLELGDQNFVTSWYLGDLTKEDHSVFHFPILLAGSQAIRYIDVSPDKTKILLSFPESVAVFAYPEMYK